MTATTGQRPPYRALWNVAWRYLVSKRWQSALMVVGIALGVAVVVSVDLANASAGRAFELSAETVAGRATHQIEGGPLGVEDSLYTRMRREGVVNLAAPVINDYVTVPQLGSQPMQLLGLDPFSDAPFRAFWGTQRSEAPDLSVLTNFLTQPGAVLISQPLAERYALKPGDPLTIIVGGYEREAFIAGLMQPADSLSQRSMEGIILADIATAQELTGTHGYLTQIDLILPDDGGRTEQRLVDWLPLGYQLIPAGARSGTIQQMTAAFQLNLTALSLLALVVGVFLIYNTMTFSVVQRRGLFGTLRCLGVTRMEVFLLVLAEAFLIGLFGGLLGVLLGLVLGQITVGMVTQTINDLYFTTTVRSVGIAPESLIKGALLGLFASVLTAALPAWEAASSPPRAALLRSGLETSARRSVWRAAGAGVVFGGLGILTFVLPWDGLLLGFAGTMLVVVAFALLSSAGLVALMRGLGPLLNRLFGLTGRMASRSLINALSRTGVAVAALMVAVAVIIGVALMIDSFRYTVTVWLEETLQGDIYISVPAFTAVRSTAVLDSEVIETVANWPGVERVDTLRAVTVDSQAGPIALAATENPTLPQERQFAALEGSPEQAWAEMQAGGVLISEPLAARLGMAQPGSTLRLLAGQEWREFTILGIYYDYSSSEGGALMALNVYRQYWQDDSLTALALRLGPAANPDETARALQDALASEQQLLIRPNQALRQDVLEVFDRTFAITIALRMLATVVAFIGVLNALLLLQMEKQREVGILRAIGLTGRQLWKLVMLETGLMGLTAGLLSFPTGYALSLILIFIINRRSFGWTLQMDMRPEVFLQALGVALAAALLAGIYPALRMSRLSAAEVIRNE
jgi:putative ABC transport system permease protein